MPMEQKAPEGTPGQGNGHLVRATTAQIHFGKPRETVGLQSHGG